MSQTLAHLTPGQRLAAARAKAYDRMPYFRAGVQSLVPKEWNKGTLGVTKGNILLVDYDVLGTWTADEAGSVILHEYMHRFLQHAERAEKLLKAGLLTNGDAGTWNDACDAEINDNLLEANCPLPKLGDKDPITPVSLGLKPHRTAEEYFQELKKKNYDSPPGAGWGQCGSGAGNPLPDEPPAGDPDERSDVDQHVQRKSDAEQIRVASASKSRGTVPQGLQRAADALLEPAVVPWEEKLGKAVRDAVVSVSGQGDFTFTERARMQSTMEWMMGDDAPVLPGEHAHRAEVAFVVDTSGSMSDMQAKRAVSEAADILKHMGGAKITFISIDAEVHTLKRVGDVKEILDGLKGGGGTDFRPAFAALEKMKPRPHIVIFATDGYGPAPAEPPEKMETIWLVIDGENSCPWGEVIDIKTESRD